MDKKIFLTTFILIALFYSCNASSELIEKVKEHSYLCSRRVSWILEDFKKLETN